MPLKCDDCGDLIDTSGKEYPPDGWQLEDGRTVCGPCAVNDLHRVAEIAKELE